MKGIYIVGGYPGYKNYLEQLKIISNFNIDFVEIGLPFNDPVADGPVIASAIDIAVKNKYSIEKIVNPAVEILKTKKIYIMTYANIVFNYDFNKFYKKINGLIIADCPNRMHYFFYKKGLKIPIIPFATINSTEQDFKLIKKSKVDFVYFIGLKGTTGGNLQIDNNIFSNIISKIKKITCKKIIFGFGIKDKNTMNKVLNFSDGCVIGTEIVKYQNNKKNFENILKNFFKWI